MINFALLYIVMSRNIWIVEVGKLFVTLLSTPTKAEAFTYLTV